MAEKVASDGAGKPHEPKIEAAELLFRDDPVARPAKPGLDSTPRAGEGEVFDLAEP